MVGSSAHHKINYIMDESKIVKVFISALLAWLLLSMAFLTTSCKVCEPIVNTEYRDSVRTEYHRDSVRMIDSVFVDRWRQGDTVFVTKMRDRYLYRDVLHTDTITIDNSKTETVQVRYVPPFYKGCTVALWVIIALCVIYVAWRIFKAIYLRR